MMQQLIWAILLLFSGFVMGHLYGSHQHSVETTAVASQHDITTEWPHDEQCNFTTSSEQTACRLAVVSSAIRR